jgi:hypothetical protein
MAVKSIVQIEIADGQWRTFNEQVKQHQAELKKMPGQWGAVGKSLATAQSAGAKFTATLKEHARQFKEANGAAGKMTLALKASDRMASSLVRNTLSVARNLKDATKSLLSWGSIMGLISGVLGAGGLFGIARLAQGVASGQSASMRSGSGYGENKAAGIAYGNLMGGAGGVESLLQTMAKEKESGGMMFRRLSPYGMTEDKWKNKSPAEMLGPFLEAIKQAYKQAPRGAEARVMSTLAPEMDFATIKQLSNTNLDVLKREYESNKRLLELSMGTQNAWSKLNRVLEASEEKISNTFVKALRPLTPALESFANALNDAIETIMTNPLVKNMIEGAGEGLKKFSTYLTDGSFSKDFQSFIAEMKKVAQAMQDTAAFFNKWFGSEKLPEASTSEQAKINALSQNRDCSGMDHGGTSQSLARTDLGRSFNITQNQYTYMPDGSVKMNYQTFAAAGGSVGK